MERGIYRKKRQIALGVLLETGNKSEVARRAEVGRTTIWRWLKQPGFRAALQIARYKSLTGERDAPPSVEEMMGILDGLRAANAHRFGYSALIENGKRALESGWIPFDLMQDLRRAALAFERQIKAAGFSLGLTVKIKRRP